MDDKEIQALVLAFQRKAALDPEIRAVMKKVAAGNADFSDTSKLFLRRSNLLRAYMQEIVPKLAQGDRERLCMALLREGYTETNDVMKRVQEALDKPQGIHLNPVQADFPQERAQTVAHALEDPTVPPETIQRRAGAPVGNVDMSFHDSFIKVNAQKRHDLGLKPFITRYGAGCCKWCAEISGKFRFGDQPADIFRRHDNCNCVIVYDTQVLRGKLSEDGKRTRTWEQVDPEEVMRNVSEPTVLSQNAAESLQNTALGRLTLAGERGILRVADSTNNFYPVARNAYEKVSSLGVFDDNRDNLIVTAMREVLKTVENEEPGTEWLALYRYNSVDFIDGILSKPGAGFVDPIECGVPYVSIHNHASGDTFSIGDIYQLTDTNCKAVFVVGNNGNCYALSKTDAFDDFGFYEKIMKRRLGFEPYTLPTEHEFIRGAKNMGSNIPKALVDLLKTAVKKTEPYPLDSEEAVVKYDDPRMQEGHPEYDRMTATIALKTLTEYGIPIE